MIIGATIKVHFDYAEMMQNKNTVIKDHVFMKKQVTTAIDQRQIIMYIEHKWNFKMKISRPEETNSLNWFISLY